MRRTRHEKVIVLDPKHRSKHKETLINLRAAARPSDDMKPGGYLVKCLGTRIQKRGYATQAILKFVVDDGPHKGVILYLWLPVREEINPGSKYWTNATVALGREPRPQEDLAPTDIFLSKTFLARVGYRSRTQDRDDDCTVEKTMDKKDDKDFLRVHELIERLNP